MSQTVTVSSEVYRKLAKGAAERGMTVQSLLAAVSDLIASPRRPTKSDRHRSERIEKLFDRFRAGQVTAGDREDLGRLIDADYQEANVRADRMIRVRRHLNPPVQAKHD